MKGTYAAPLGIGNTEGLCGNDFQLRPEQKEKNGLLKRAGTTFQAEGAAEIQL